MPSAVILSLVLSVAAAYLIGSIPFGLLIGRWARGIDLREHGSLNIGATNAARVLGARWGLAVLLLDALKGLAPTWLLPTGLLPLTGAPPELTPHLRVACGAAAIIGHMFPAWLGFRGGKGVATSLGVVAVVAPWGSLIAVAAFALVFACTRIVSASSIVAAVSLAAAQCALLRPHPFTPEHWSVGLFSLLAPLLVIVRHRTNIARLWRGEERRFGAATSTDRASAEGPTADRATADRASADRATDDCATAARATAPGDVAAEPPTTKQPG